MLKRKKVLLIICFAAICMISAPASAGMYTMDASVAGNLRDISWSDATGSGSNVLKWVGNNPGAAGDTIYASGLASYGDPTPIPMVYQIGFVGNLSDWNALDGEAWVKIGAAHTYGSNPMSTLQGLGSFEGFQLPISNDDDDMFQYKLYANFAANAAGGDTYYVSPTWTPLNSDTQATLTLDFSDLGGPAEEDFGNLKDIGFIIRIVGDGRSDDFHTSIVPIPTAVLLGILGLGAVGIKLRKYA